MPYKDPEKRRAYLREFKKKPEQRAKTAKRARDKRKDPEDAERTRANEKRWRDENPEKVKAKNERNYEGLASSRRNSQLRILYGIDHAEYERLLEAQGGGCAICGATESRRKGRKHLSVDHCHKTGKVRGVLCDPCNNGLGRFGDDTKLLRKAIEYLTG